MMILDKDGLLGRGDWLSGMAAGDCGRFDLSPELLDRRGALLDELFAFVFDVLDLRRIEIRVRLAPSIKEQSHG